MSDIESGVEHFEDNAEIADVGDHFYDTVEDAVQATLKEEAKLTQEEEVDSEELEEVEADETDETDVEESEEEVEADEGEELDNSLAVDSDDSLVDLSTGEQVKLGELKKGYFRQKDYTHKTEALAQERKEIEEVRTRFNEDAVSLKAAYDNLTEFLGGLIPPEPDLALAQSDMNAYQYQIAVRNNAIAELQKVFQKKEEANSVLEGFNSREMESFIRQEQERLIEAMPNLRDPGTMASFNNANLNTAKEFGFSEEEVKSTYDSRMLQVLHYARIGKIAEKNRENAKRRVAEKPKTGVNTSKKTPISNKSSKRAEIMKRFKKTGSLEDAVLLDTLKD